jgi:pre-mRNA-splicing factor SYF2
MKLLFLLIVCLIDIVILGLERGEPQPPSIGAGTPDAAAAAEQQPDDNDAENQEDACADDGYPQMTEKQERLFELRLKMVR